MKKVCKKCGAVLEKETDIELKKEYPYYCPYCDENKYLFECEDMSENVKSKEMDGVTKFIDWLLEVGYLDEEDILMDGVEITKDLNKIKEVAPKFYNMLMCMCNCEERA